MKLRIDFETPYFGEEMIGSMTPEDLNDFYAEADETDQLNLFFVLEASLHRLLQENRPAEAAHCAFLMAYYVFVPLTPPASGELANYYIDKALELNTISEYQEWKSLIERGN